jgi:hypothetical protein
MSIINELCQLVRETAYAIHVYHGHGHLEKACRALVNEHTAQILGYLRSARKEHGLLMNFGSYKFQIRKYAMSSQPLAI